jgi:hypothetical protein
MVTVIMIRRACVGRKADASGYIAVRTLPRVDCEVSRFVELEDVLPVVVGRPRVALVAVGLGIELLVIIPMIIQNIGDGKKAIRYRNEIASRKTRQVVE